MLRSFFRFMGWQEIIPKELSSNMSNDPRPQFILSEPNIPQSPLDRAPVRRKRIKKGVVGQNVTDVESDSYSSDASQVLNRRNSGARFRRPIPTQRRAKTLVLDLDETLIHSTSRGSRNHDHTIEVLVDKHVSDWYKVVIFTASMPEYADPVIDWLDSNRTLISKRYFRQV
ncbi:Nuclear envelope morphology protein 1 [Nowakowskiella sp. JEL0078]|nr:Nuclear envelope morphology protein 1 [Nowakowskiella sp. JEL0078]